MLKPVPVRFCRCHLRARERVEWSRSGRRGGARRAMRRGCWSRRGRRDRGERDRGWCESADADYEGTTVRRSEGIAGADDTEHRVTPFIRHLLGHTAGSCAVFGQHRVDGLMRSMLRCHGQSGIRRATAQAVRAAGDSRLSEKQPGLGERDATGGALGSRGLSTSKPPCA